MKKTIFLTGATDGIGLETAKSLASQGHSLLLHGRNPAKLASVKQALAMQFPGASLDTFVADFANLTQVHGLSEAITSTYTNLDVLINNAGVFKLSEPVDERGYDRRFLVNAVAPYLLTLSLLPVLGDQSRVVNLSSAAQAPVSTQALLGQKRLSDSEAYAQSKLAITMWTSALANLWGDNGPALVAVNPASFLGSKMVKEAYGLAGKDVSIGADVVVRAALDPAFAEPHGRYFDNDIGQWSQPHPDGLKANHQTALVEAIESVLNACEIAIPPKAPNR